jgi:hypothetical protein
MGEVRRGERERERDTTIKTCRKVAECQWRALVSLVMNFIFFFFMKKPSVFAICKNTFSKWKVGGRMDFMELGTQYVYIGFHIAVM